MLTVESVRCFEAKIPLTVSFSHASADRVATESVFVEIADRSGIVGYGEGCPRSYVTGETVTSVHAFINRQRKRIGEIHCIEDIKNYLVGNREAVDTNPAGWCAVELALLDLLGKLAGQPVEALLKPITTRDDYIYSAVLGDASAASFQAMYARYRLQKFQDFKIKLNGDLQKDRDKLDCLRQDLDAITVRADANNLWHSQSDAQTYLLALDIPFTGIEEPVQSRDIAEVSELTSLLDMKVILDESFLRFDQIALLTQSPDNWIVNVRVSKMGGLLRSISIVSELVKQNIEITVGCQVGESSLLTRAALILADAASHKLNSQEGAFGKLLLSEEPFVPCLQFGRRGLLASGQITMRDDPGFGMTRDESVTFTPLQPN